MEAVQNVKLVNSIGRFYEQYRNRRASIACTLAIILGLVTGLFVFQLIPLPTAFAMGFGLAFLTALGVLLISMVPESRDIDSIQALMEYALNHPRAVELCEGGRLVRIRKNDQATDIGGVHAVCWMKCVEPVLEKPSSVMSGSYKAMVRMEQELKDRQAELEQFKAKLNSEAANLEERSAFITQSEEDLMMRLHHFSEREAELEQLTENLQSQARGSAVDGRDPAEIAAREREIKEMRLGLEKEAAELESKKQELDSLREELAADKGALNAGIDDLSCAIGNAEASLPAGAQSADSDDGLAEKENELMELKALLAREAAELEARSRQIAETENALIDKLNELDTREVAIEQKEEDLSATELGRF